MSSREERFRAIFDATYPAIVAYVRRRAAATDIDDVVAEVFTVAWRRLDDVPDDRALPWLYATARRVLANHHRSGTRRLRLLDRLQREPVALFEPGGSVDDVVVALSSLPPTDQEVLRLAAWEGLPASDIAAAIGCSANAAALRLSRARARLRAAITERADCRTRAPAEGLDG